VYCTNLLPRCLRCRYFEAYRSFGGHTENQARGGLCAPQAALAAEVSANFAPNDPPGEWHSQARDYANTRYSPLDEINLENVKQLRIAWSFSDGVNYGHEGAPLVIGATMYVLAPFPNVAYALDLSKPGAPIKWTYTPDPSPLTIGKACCDAVVRGWAFADGKLIYNLLDDHTVADSAFKARRYRGRF
jgi:lanthanide-dependent methanol dehydrogenase